MSRPWARSVRPVRIHLKLNQALKWTNPVRNRRIRIQKTINICGSVDFRFECYGYSHYANNNKRKWCPFEYRHKLHFKVERRIYYKSNKPAYVAIKMPGHYYSTTAEYCWVERNWVQLAGLAILWYGSEPVGHGVAVPLGSVWNCTRPLDGQTWLEVGGVEKQKTFAPVKALVLNARPTPTTAKTAKADAILFIKLMPLWIKRLNFNG